MNNKRKLDDNEFKQNKKIHDDLTIEDIFNHAKEFNNESLTEEPKVFMICDDGEICQTKANMLLWQRSFHTWYPPLDTDIRFKMPMVNKNIKCSFAFVTFVDALRLRVDMAKYANIKDDYSSVHLEHKLKNEDTDPDDWWNHYDLMMDKKNKN
jgi:hypothetical protein